MIRHVTLRSTNNPVATTLYIEKSSPVAIENKMGTSGCTTDIDWRSKYLHHPYPVMGLQLGVFGFPVIKITVIHQVYMYCSLSVKINMHEILHGPEGLWMHFVCICLRVWSAKPEYPSWNSMTDDTVTRGGIGVLESPFYICGMH